MQDTRRTVNGALQVENACCRGVKCFALKVGEPQPKVRETLRCTNIIPNERML